MQFCYKKAMNLQHPIKDKKGQTILFKKVLQRQNLFLQTLNGNPASCAHLSKTFSIEKYGPRVATI